MKFRNFCHEAKANDNGGNTDKEQKSNGKLSQREEQAIYINDTHVKQLKPEHILNFIHNEIVVNLKYTEIAYVKMSKILIYQHTELTRLQINQHLSHSVGGTEIRAIVIEKISSNYFHYLLNHFIFAPPPFHRNFYY